MKVPYDIPFEQLVDVINSHYPINARALTFIPVGDKSYSYQIDCVNGEKYYLKLLDRRHQQVEIKQTDYYLPLLLELHHKNLFPHAIYPLLNNRNEWKAELENILLILFPWIEGDTLANAYPLSKNQVRTIAKLAAKLHQTTPAIAGEVQLPFEKFDVSFLDELLVNIEKLVNQSLDLADYKLALSKLLIPKKDDIHSFTFLVKELNAIFIKKEMDLVLCHGDLWGGNLIQAKGGITIIDWESVILAPFEREMAGYVTQSPLDFIDAYSKQMGRKIKPNTDLLRYYCFSAHLRNLHYWMNNILHHNINDDQQANDLDMIENHCLNRWEEIDVSLQRLASSVS
ncbi:phosphotransferase [Pseudogracilibacillus auburnensis]|uniref:phosphotransferase n=1 Tax=Pseudogracilibacillus auburnensis TaxID=1494959 RepID=UPI001A958394|nr:phosphotransferase [Pseudogracilibacillus auburnensis]MBO1005338.1 phosphotransferase [Pseudogracilibacillus auburnensis]